MFIKDYISKDYPAFNSSDRIEDANEIAKEFGYSHIFVKKKGIYQGAVSQSFLEESPEGSLGSLAVHFEKFAILDDGNLLDSINLFHAFNANVIPVISRVEKYVGYLSCDDIFNEFSKYPLFSENGAVMIVQTNDMHYSFTEVCKIVESNNAMILHSSMSTSANQNFIRISLKINKNDLKDIQLTFERYQYNVIAVIHQSEYEVQLKERYDSLMKYLEV